MAENGRTAIGAGPLWPASSRRSLLAGIGLAGIGVSLAACGGRGDRAGRPELHFCNRDNYIGENTLGDFTDHSGIAVRTSHFGTNDELFATLSAGNSGYDVIVPSSEFVARMRHDGLLQPLDMEKIPNFANIDAEFQDNSYDEAPQHSVPYTWLVMGIGYRKSRVNGTPDSWKWLFDSDLYTGRIALSAESVDLIRLGACYLGYGPNALTPDIIARVEELLVRQKPHIRAFHQGDGFSMLERDEVDLVLETNGDIARLARRNLDIGFVVPGEGSLLHADTLCIPADAPNPGLAHDFINFLLDAEVGKDILANILFPTPNAAARAMMPASYAEDPVIFPAGAGMDNSQWRRFDGPEEAEALARASAHLRAA